MVRLSALKGGAGGEAEAYGGKGETCGDSGDGLAGVNGMLLG